MVNRKAGLIGHCTPVIIIPIRTVAMMNAKAIENQKASWSWNSWDLDTKHTKAKTPTGAKIVLS